MLLSPDILARVQRVLDFHRASALSDTTPAPTPADAPPPLHFADAPKIPLPTSLLDAPAPLLEVLRGGLDVLPESQLTPPQDLKTLASWLYLGYSLSHKIIVNNQPLWLRTCPSAGALYPCEIYVAAFNVAGLEPGLYHYSPREFALRQLRRGLATLWRLKRGRPDLDFLRTAPAALLISTLYARTACKYQQRAYRYVLEDAGHLAQNLATAGTGLGLQTLTRLRSNDATAREVIGLPADAPFAQAENVQAVVVWADPATTPIEGRSADDAGDLPPIPRPAPAQTISYGSILATHADCAGPGVAIREIRPALTELSVLSAQLLNVEMTRLEDAVKGLSVREAILRRRSSRDFSRRNIARDALWEVNEAGFRRGTFFPIFPAGPYVGLIRPMWIVHDVSGMDAGLWYYDPPADRWAQMRAGDMRFETRYAAAEQDSAGNASAVCFMVANLHALMNQGGPDLYRLTHLEAGAAAQRMALAATALELGSQCLGAFYDADAHRLLGLTGTWWTPIYALAIGPAQ